MGDFLEALGEFLRSDFAKDNTIQIIVLEIVIIFIIIFLTSVFFNKILVPIKLRRSDYIIPEYKEALKKIERLELENTALKKEIREYKRERDMEKALDSDGLQEEFDKGLGGFLKK